MIRIRPEAPTDFPAIRVVHYQAFDDDAEADLVDALRHRGRVALSLVAVEPGKPLDHVVGHILFSRVRLGRLPHETPPPPPTFVPPPPPGYTPPPPPTGSRAASAPRVPVVTAAADADEGGSIVGLAPLAVVPSHQGQGIGHGLVRAGLKAVAQAGHRACVVLGSPRFYGSLGFTDAREFGLTSEYGAEPEFQALELQPRGLENRHGMVFYPREFRALGV